MKRIGFLVVVALILSVASARAQQPTFAMLGVNGCSGATPYGNASWCFDSVTTTNPGLWYNNNGTFTLVAGASGTTSVGELTINTGVTPTAGGYQAFTESTGLCTTTGAGGTCAEPTQTVTFKDANYFINCTCNGALTGVPVVAAVTTKSSNAVVVTIAGVTGVSASCAAVDCVAIHK